MARRRVIKVFRYDPATGEEARFDRFELEIQTEAQTTILDVLLRLQREQDPSLSFRYACRVAMCGSCAMVVNGREALACKTVVADLPGEEITLRPLNHFPVVKDLVADLEPFFQSYQEALPYFEPASPGPEPAIIPPRSRERRAIGLATECIACGCCVSACTMVHWHQDYLGPAALNRAFTLLADSRDALGEARLARVLEGCYNCRLEFNCTEVCPKEISPTRAIKYIQRLALGQAWRPSPRPPRPLPDEPRLEPVAAAGEEMTRRRALAKMIYALGGATALGLGAILGVATLAPAARERARQWRRVGEMDEFQPGAVASVEVRYPVQDGFYRGEASKTVLVSRLGGAAEVVAFDSRCPHLGCRVRWDERQRLFLCACHGGTFHPDGAVKAGPPTRPLDRYEIKVESGQLFILEG